MISEVEGKQKIKETNFYRSSKLIPVEVLKFGG